MNENLYKFPVQMEVELTSKCTLACPVCPRTKDPDERFNYWKFGELSVETLEKILQQPAVRLMNYTGSHGDAIYHSKLHEIIKLTKSYDKQIFLTTAASHRRAEWWESLAPLFTEKDTIQFSIDGLSHNNHIYRKNSDWSSIETALKIMGQSRANTIWKWIVFNHNQNDVVEGYKLSQQLKIKQFSVVESGRQQDMYSKPFNPTRPFADILAELEEYIENENKSNVL
jgi:MoaA/NifB/PqqE/SkfB family radical SAM enzyme